MPEIPPVPEKPPMPEIPPVPEKPPIPEAPPGFEPQIGSQIPPPPPGFESNPVMENKSVIVSSWEELPPGGDYIESDPLQYTGDGIGTWIERPDESWEKITK